MCRSTLKVIAREHLNYNDIVEIIEKITEKLVLSQNRLRKKDFTKKEVLILRFFTHNRLEVD
jgi:hypothetical protein